MSLEAKLLEDMKAAMKAKDQITLRTVRAIKSAMMLAKTSEGFSGELSDDDIMKIITKQAKQRKDSIEAYESNGRDDLAATEKEELEVLERYLPKQLSEAEIEANVKAILEETGASSMKDMGKVMGLANQRMAGAADGKAIAAIVKKQLGL